MIVSSPSGAMRLRILLPSAVLLERDGVRRIVADTAEGSFGFWPNRLDCATVLVPGILTFESAEAGEQFAAIDRGVLTKTGADVTVAVRNGVLGGDLGSLRKTVDEQFVRLDEGERLSRSLLTKMESELIRETTRIRHG